MTNIEKKEKEITVVSKDVEKSEPLPIISGNAKHADFFLMQPLWEIVWQFLTKLHTELSHKTALHI